MTFTTIKGGAAAIAASHRLVARRRRGDPRVAELGIAQIREQLSLAVDRVMAEGALYDPTLAALAIKQAEGDVIEAIFLLRAYRATLPRFGTTAPVAPETMIVRRRISTTHKDVPGGQILGPTYDYTHRLLDFSLLDDVAPAADDIPPPEVPDADGDAQLPRDVGILAHAHLIEAEPPEDYTEVADITQTPLSFPAGRDQRLQALARGDEGFLMSLAYSTMRGLGRNHPVVAEMRHGDVTVTMEIPEIGLEVGIGEVRLTECRTVHLHKGDATRPPQFTRGYGLVFGHGERKALSMALVDRAMRSRELDEPVLFPAQDDDFMLNHADSVAASGLVQHLKLPHYVDFQAALQLLDELREDHATRYGTAGGAADAE